MIRKVYQEGIERFRNRESDWGGGHFAGIYRTFEVEEGAWEFLREQLEDGHWAYRCDDMTRLYALAGFYDAIVYSDAEHRKKWPGHQQAARRQQEAKGAFCGAIQVRPDVIFELVKRERLSPAARAAFEAAKRDPFCNPKGGWRSPTAGPRRPYK